MIPARALSAAALALVVGVVGWLLLGSNGEHRYELRFENAGQLVKGDDVQVGGRRVGSVRRIQLTDDNQAQITIGVRGELAPLHEGTTAIIRATSLSGVANRYVALTPGPNNRDRLPDGAVLDAQDTTAPVDLDQVFDALDPTTRRSLAAVINGSARQYAGRGADVNAAARYLNPALSRTTAAVSEVAGDQQTLSDFLRSSSRVLGTLAKRRAALTHVVTNANTTAASIAGESASLDQALGHLPRALHRANSTFGELRATLGDLDTLVDVAKPATRRLAPFLRELRPLVADARPTVADLRVLVRKTGPGNDLIDLLRRTPRLDQVSAPAFAHTIAALGQATPVLAFARPYAPDLVGLLREFGQGAANYDANGHYARIQPVFNAFSVSGGGVLTPIPPSARTVGLQSGNLRRCPGAASQAPADGSAPFRDAGGALDCDPSQVLPGP